MSSDPLNFDELQAAFASGGAADGIDTLIAKLRGGSEHHSLFRALLLKKRHALNLPLINPGELAGHPEHLRKQYEDFVEQACEEIGRLYLRDENIPQAWRYFRTIGKRAPVREALDKLPPEKADDEVLSIALEQGVHPRRGFELLLKRHGLCRAITVFDHEFYASPDDKKAAAGLLIRALYAELVVGVREQIRARFNELPPETDLVDLIRHRPWLFEQGNTHADPQHVGAVSRIGLLTENYDEMLMTLSISEYGRMLSPEHHPVGRPPFEDGFGDHARYMRALLGQDVGQCVEYFCSRLGGYARASEGTYPAEMVVLLLWRAGRKPEALGIWENFLDDQPPDLAGLVIPPFYEMCLAAMEYTRMAEVARKKNDAAAWAAAQALLKPSPPAGPETLS
jgi:hypothetical protein